MKFFVKALLCIGTSLSLSACAVNMQTGVDENSTPRIVCTSAQFLYVMERLDLDLAGIPKTTFPIPERYKNVTEVGAPMSPDMEIIKSLKATDVITPNSLQYDLKPKYDGAGISSTFLSLSSLEGMFQSIQDLGEKYDRQSQAESLVAEFETFMQEFQRETEGNKQPTVLILMGLPGTYMVATEASYVGSLVRLAGGINVFPDETGGFLTVNTEEMHKKEPDIILRTAHAMPDMVMDMFKDEFVKNDIWKHFGAVKEGRVFDLSYEEFGMSANLNYPTALGRLKEVLYGGATE